MFLLHALIFYEIYYNIWYTIANIVVEIYEIWQEKYKMDIFSLYSLSMLYVRHYNERSTDLY